jgi:FkbM family methyltransferase
MKLKNFFKKKKAETKQVQVGNYTLWANAEHSIGDHLKHYPYYSRNLPRIAKYLEVKYPQYSIIDVGANIGDTIALLRTAQVDQQVYLIEGEPSYFKLMQANLPQFNKAKAYLTFLGEESTLQTGAIVSAEGTARLDKNAPAVIHIQKLDELALTEQFEEVKLLKIDTDGFDFKILRGSFELLTRFKPVLFFEYDAVYLEEQNEDGLQTLHTLQQLGYHKAVYYDNYGKMLLSTTLDNQPLAEQLYAYMRRREGAFPYYDVCVFHQDDEELADEVIRQEMKFYS